MWTYFKRILVLLMLVLLVPGKTVMAEDITPVYDSVEEMRADSANLKAGDWVRTKGYYTADDKGGALYNIVQQGSMQANESNIIQLDNQLLAVLKIENDTVNVKQYGARGDGSGDDHKAIRLAVTSGAGTIYFESGEYKCTDELCFYNVHDVTIEGMGAVIYTDDDYRKGLNWKEHFISFVGTNAEKAKNITIRNLKVETRGLYNQEVGQKYKNQIVFQYVDQILVERCEFYISRKFPFDLEKEDIPEAARKLEYSCLDLYTGWENVTVRNCRIRNEAGAHYGVCAQFRDIWNAGGKNVLFYDNYCYSNSKDEIIAIFSGESSKSYIKDVTIRNNEIVADATPFYVRNMCMTVGYDSSNCCDNIQIYNNKITGVCDWAFFGMGKTLTNSSIHNNEVVCKTDNTSTKAAIVRTADIDGEYSNVFTENTITVAAYKGNGLQSVFAAAGHFKGNTILSEEKVYAIFNGNGYYEENEVKVNNGVSFIGKFAKHISGNRIQIRDNLAAGFEFYEVVLNEKVMIDGNQIKVEGENVGTLLLLNGTTINGYPLILCNNKVEAPNCQDNAVSVSFQLKDNTSQTVYLVNNDLGPYEKIVQVKGETGVVHSISNEMPEEQSPDTDIPSEEEQKTEASAGSEKTEAIHEQTGDENKDIEKENSIKVESMRIYGNSHKIAAGRKVNLKLDILPKNAPNKSVVWTSGNKKYATVNRNGKVTTKKAGKGKTVVITAKAKDGSGKIASYKIKIMKNAVTRITIKKKPKTIKAGKSIKLAAKVQTNGKNANKKLVWSTSNPKYAVVNQKGKVTAKKAGKNKTVIITATSTDGTNKKGKVKIRIK